MQWSTGFKVELENVSNISGHFHPLPWFFSCIPFLGQGLGSLMAQGP